MEVMVPAALISLVLSEAAGGGAQCQAKSLNVFEDILPSLFPSHEMFPSRPNEALSKWLL